MHNSDCRIGWLETVEIDDMLHVISSHPFHSDFKHPVRFCPSCGKESSFYKLKKVDEDITFD